MARPPQFPLSEPDSLAVARVKSALKELSPEGRAYVMAWFVKFYRDDGMMYSPSVELTRFRGHFRSYIEGVQHGKEAPYLPSGVPA